MLQKSDCSATSVPIKNDCEHDEWPVCFPNGWHLFGRVHSEVSDHSHGPAESLAVWKQSPLLSHFLHPGLPLTIPEGDTKNPFPSPWLESGLRRRLWLGASKAAAAWASVARCPNCSVRKCQGKHLLRKNSWKCFNRRDEWRGCAVYKTPSSPRS